MNSNRPPAFSARDVVVGAVFLAAALFLFSGFHSADSSCHLCRNRRRVDSPTWMGVGLWPREVLETNFPVAPGHRHVWYRYGDCSRGPLWLGSAGGSWRVYRDGGAAPDGRR